TVEDVAPGITNYRQRGDAIVRKLRELMAAIPAAVVEAEGEYARRKAVAGGRLRAERGGWRKQTAQAGPGPRACSLGRHERHRRPEDRDGRHDAEPGHGHRDCQRWAAVRKQVRTLEPAFGVNQRAAERRRRLASVDE